MPPGIRCASARSATADATLLTAIAAGLRDGGDRRGRAGAGRGPGAAARRLPPAGWIVSVDREDRQLADRRPRAWISRPIGRRGRAQLRNTAKRKAKAAGLDIDDIRPLRRGRLGRLRSGLPGELEARGRLLPLPARARRAGGRGRDAAARHRPQGRPAGRGPALAGREWRGDASTSSLMPRTPRRCRRARSSAWRCSATSSTSDRVRAIDYGTGDEAYKRRLDGGAAARCWRLAAFNPRTPAAACSARRGRSASALVRRRRSR